MKKYKRVVFFEIGNRKQNSRKNEKVNMESQLLKKRVKKE